MLLLLRVSRAEAAWVSLPMVNNASKEQRAGSAIFYGVVSCTLMLLNKQVFAVGFPSHKALALAQMFTTCVVLTVLRLLGKVQFPAPSIASVKAVFPLPLFFLLNLVAGLGGTASLSLPMFTSLRRFSIWFTLIAERYVFGTQHSFSIKMAVGTMVLGSLVAAMNDLAFDSAGYFYATVNNFATAGNGISTKLKLEAKNLGVAGVLFYNSLLSMLILATYVVLFDMENFNESRAFAGWSSPSFVLMFGELLYNVLSLSLSLSDLRSHVLSHSPTSFSAPPALSLSRSLALSLCPPPPPHRSDVLRNGPSHQPLRRIVHDVQLRSHRHRNWVPQEPPHDLYRNGRLQRLQVFLH